MVRIKSSTVKRISIISLSVFVASMAAFMFAGCNEVKESESQSESVTETESSFTMPDEDSLVKFVPDDKPMDFIPSDGETLIKHCKCPSDNLFGLKEIFVYEHTVITVFDRDGFDSPSLYRFDKAPEGVNWTWSYEDVKKLLGRRQWSWCAGLATVVVGDERICINKYNKPYEERESGSDVSILGRSIVLSDEKITLSYEEDFTADILIDHYQEYDIASGVWCEPTVEEWN